MILCLDCGNTRLKWGLFQPGKGWLGTGALALADLMSLELPPARLAMLANVAGPTAEAAIQCALGDTPLIQARSCKQQCGVRNGYDTPGQLGVDRWAALIGARALHPGPALVVMAGTATTVDFLDAEGLFRGGLILPGLDLMRQSLARNTAGLALLEGDMQAFPTNTADAIHSGCLAGQAGAIERQFARLADAGGPEALCLLSGGAAPAIAPLLSIPFRPVENLVLEGLAAMGMDV